MRNLTSRSPSPPPPPPPPAPPPPAPPPLQLFGPILPLRSHIFIRRKRKNNPPPIPAPPPPPPIPLQPILPLRYLIMKRRRRRNNSPPVSLIHRDMLTWYFLTLMMHQKLQTGNQQLEETRKEWVISIKDKMEQVLSDDASTSWAKLCIYRVPHYLQENDNKSPYFPQTISIGPYHHGSKHLLPMEHHKWRAVNMVMKRTHQSIEMYIDAMKELEEKARACYQGPISLSSNEFTEMLVLDGCFVLEIFLGADIGFYGLGYALNDPVFTMRGLMNSIQHDMFMLENQLPLFVLNRLINLQVPTWTSTHLVAQLAVRFFDPLFPRDKPLTKTKQFENWQGDDGYFHPIADKDKGELHCLDVFRRSLLRPSMTPEPRLSRGRHRVSRLVDKRQQKAIHCVTKLKNAGINFKTRKTDKFWDITFKNGYLEIPKLFIHDGTKSLFLNLIAFEQCHTGLSNDITSYIVFMDNLMGSQEEVSHLRSCGIIEHWLESDSKVAHLFNRVDEEIIFDLKDSYLCELLNVTDRYYYHHNKYYRKWNAWKTTLKEKYFDSPWAYVSFFAAVVLLFLTLCQSYFAGYAYFKPAS